MMRKSVTLGSIAGFVTGAGFGQKFNFAQFEEVRSLVVSFTSPSEKNGTP